MMVITIFVIFMLMMMGKEDRKLFIFLQGRITEQENCLFKGCSSHEGHHKYKCCSTVVTIKRTYITLIYTNK